MYAHKSIAILSNISINGHGHGWIVIFEANELVLPEFPPPVSALRVFPRVFLSIPWTHVTSF